MSNQPLDNEMMARIIAACTERKKSLQLFRQAGLVPPVLQDLPGFLRTLPSSSCDNVQIVFAAAFRLHEPKFEVHFAQPLIVKFAEMLAGDDRDFEGQPVFVDSIGTPGEATFRFRWSQPEPMPDHDGRYTTTAHRWSWGWVRIFPETGDLALLSRNLDGLRDLLSQLLDAPQLAECRTLRVMDRNWVSSKTPDSPAVRSSPRWRVYRDATGNLVAEEVVPGGPWAVTRTTAEDLAFAGRVHIFHSNGNALRLCFLWPFGEHEVPDTMGRAHVVAF